MAITYTKLKDGSWGIRAEGVTIKDGQTVTVEKRSGEKKTETIGKVFWSGDGVMLATVVGKTTETKPAGRSSRRSGGGVCAECGRGGRLVQDLEDGLMKHYNCCDIPPGG